MVLPTAPPASLSVSQILTEFGIAAGTQKRISNDLFPLVGGTAGATCSLAASFSGKSAALYTFTTVTVTPGGATGPYGPTISQIRSGLTGTPSPSNWYNTYLSMTTQGISKWTVPADGMYTITAAGARGGTTVWIGSGYINGAIMTGTFSLTKGEVLYILVGQHGQDSSGGSYGGGGGGGGGTFVVRTPYNTTASCIIAAGGGGGGGSSGINLTNEGNGLITTSGGNQPRISSTTVEGTGGDNGGGGGGSAEGGGSGGAGFCGNGGLFKGYTGSCTTGGGAGYNGCGNGGNATCGYTSSTIAPAYSFLNGGVGGISSASTPAPTGPPYYITFTCPMTGGFGGGGATEGCSPFGGGGGGGYSGGGGTGYGANGRGYPLGFGGGSVNTGTSQTNTIGGNFGDGYVIITKV